MSRARKQSWAALREDMTQSTARAFSTLYRRFQEATNAGYASRGWKGVTLSDVQFLVETGEEGTRLSDVAQALGSSKQYVGKLAKELESKGLVTFEADHADGRVVLAVPTARARRLLQDACEVRAELEREFLKGLSAARTKAFAETLRELAARAESV